MAYQRRSPNHIQLVADVARRFAEEWEAARKKPDGTRDDRFIRRLAWEGRKVDPNIGLNGKRGGDEISTDALAYVNPTAPGGVEVIDVIVGASHSPAWQDVTIPPSAEHPSGVLGKLIAPTDPGGGPGGGGGGHTGGTGGAINADLAALAAQLAELTAKVAQQQQQIDALKAAAATPLPKRVGLKSDHGLYICAQPDGRLLADRTARGAWETFRIEPAD